MTASELITLLSALPPDEPIVLAIPAKIGGLDVYWRGNVRAVDYLPTSFHNTKRQLCLIGETENGYQGSGNTSSE